MSANTDPYAEMIDAAYGPVTVRLQEHERREAQQRIQDYYNREGGSVVAAPYRSVLEQAEEVRVVDPTSGGMKGAKLAKFSSIPADVLWELAEHYGKGEAKYPNDEDGKPNWQRGYDWRLTVDAMLRHINQFLMGEDIDPETGSSHLVAAMWHLAALRWFQLHDKGRDFRG